MSAAAPEVRLDDGLAPSGEVLRRLVEDRVASRLFAGDATLWGPEAEAEAAQRLGWVDVFERGEALVPELERLRGELHGAGVERVVLCGMGGSSLAPEVITRRDGAPLIVLDSTHPAEVRRALEGPSRTLAIVSSKSGTTIETLSQLAAFEAAFAAAGISAAERIIVVTDPGSALHARAERSGYRVFLADPDVGGRYSALTAFGLVPSVLAGADGRALLAEARAAADELRRDEPGNPALRLAAALAGALPERYLCLLAEPGGEGGEEAEEPGTHLAEWIEQLVAESTGKQGRGVLPIAVSAGAPELRPGWLSAAALAVRLSPEPGRRALPPFDAEVAGALGAQFLLWEVATAVLGRLIGVNPFDQPDVESAKQAARAVLAEAGAAADAPPHDALERPSAVHLLAEIAASLEPNGYVALQAYVDREGAAPLAELRDRLAERLGAPVALGFGPRYLHSTGQFHKGGPRLGVFVQILGGAAADQPIPGGDAGFGALIAAQARGDREVLAGLGRPVFAIDESEVARLLAALRA